MGKNALNKTSKKTQGQLLKELYYWSGENNVKEFTARFNRSRQWADNAFQWEIIPVKEKIAICKAYNIPPEYFEGTFELPLVPTDTSTIESSAREKFELDLKKESIELKDQLMEQYKKYIDLQDKYTELQEELTRLLRQINKK